MSIVNKDSRSATTWSAVLLAAVMVWSIWLAALGSSPALADNGSARIEVPDDYFYFGYMPRDAVVAHTYWIKNTGSDTLKIVKVKPTCGCTAAPLPQDRVAPGDSANLTISFNSKLMTGKVVKDIDIFCNDPHNEVKSIKFFAVVNQIYPNVLIEPATLRFAKFGSEDGRIVKEMTISNKFDDDVKISFTEFPGEYFTIDKKEATIEPGEEAKFMLEQIKVPTEEKDFMNSLTLQIDGPETERITVPIVCYFKRGE